MHPPLVSFSSCFTVIWPFSIALLNKLPSFLHTQKASRRESFSVLTKSLMCCRVSGKYSFRIPSSVGWERILSTRSTIHVRNSWRSNSPSSYMYLLRVVQ